jgi:hypothetical protein
MKIFSLIISLTIIINLKSQKLSIIGDFNKNNYYVCSSLLSTKKISLQQLKNGETKLKKIKEFSISLISDVKVNTNTYQKTLDFFLEKHVKSNTEVVFITLNNPNTNSTETLIGKGKKIIDFKEFTSTSHLFKNTINILLLAPSFIEFESIEPTNTSIITEYNVKFILKGIAKHPLDSVSIQVNGYSNPLPKNCFADWNINSGEFTINYNLETIDYPNDKKINIQIKLVDKNGFTYTKDINGISVQKAFLNASYTDIGEVAPKTYNKYPFYAVSIESNINLTNVEVEYFDRNKKPYVNARMTKSAKVLPCVDNEKIVIIKPEQSPVSWTIQESNNNLVNVYSSTISNNYKHSLCGYHWEGYVQFRCPNTSIVSELIKIKLPGFDDTDKIEFEIIECY